MNDNCDFAGIWDGDFEEASFLIGEKVQEADFEEFADIFAGRVEKLQDEKWLLPTFIPFQYGELSKKSTVHRAVIGLLKKRGVFQRYEQLVVG